MELNSLRDLYIEQMRDLYDAENQLIKALPKMAQAATSSELQQGLELHLSQTKEHAQRLETSFEQLNQKPKGEKCKGMEGLIKEGSEFLDEEIQENVRDAAIIAGAQRVEHYEIAAYGTARTFATLLGESEAASLLQQTLDEEKETDGKLTKLAEGINVEAQEVAAETSEEEKAKPRGTSRKRVA